eukprot:CAMPEP_0182447232 /NCGR_PEP_ID=MMETSP1172-20130603/13267_1 /TAXON_ID=708627 /ORGANISM="Timspurckia oligopyrenoides, Strain CCMP3278" /LENGTH=439 /DNA_ID=CAMNT_0024643603 /DNA_START=13 /DNA_END=1332 /DNA_ORIENTATION=+
MKRSINQIHSSTPPLIDTELNHASFYNGHTTTWRHSSQPFHSKHSTEHYSSSKTNQTKYHRLWQLHLQLNHSQMTSFVPSFIQLREWSNHHQSLVPSVVYTIRVAFGEEVNKLPSWITSSKKEVIVNLCRNHGMNSIGTKSALLQQLKNSQPWITLKIDGRECIQRLAVLIKSQFVSIQQCQSESAVFTVEMPRKGDTNVLGVKKLKDLDEYKEVYWCVEKVLKSRERKRLSGSGRRSTTKYDDLDGDVTVGSDCVGNKVSRVECDKGGESGDESCVSSTPCRCRKCGECEDRELMKTLVRICSRESLEVREVLEWDWNGYGSVRRFRGKVIAENSVPQRTMVDADCMYVSLSEYELESGDAVGIAFGEGGKVVAKVEAVEEESESVLEEVVVQDWKRKLKVRAQVVQRGGAPNAVTWETLQSAESVGAEYSSDHETDD